MTFYIDQALESAGEELVDYVLCHRMFRVTKRNLKKHPQQKGELLCRTQYKFLNLRKTSYPSDQVSDYNESWSCKNWRPSSLFSLYVRINICIASHFTQGTWRESQTSYPNFKSLHCSIKQHQVYQQNYFHVFSGFLQIFLGRKTLAFTQHFHLFQNLFKTSDGLLSKLINGVGNVGIEIFTDIRIPSNNVGKKGKERKILTCDKLTTECVINLGFVVLLPGLVLFFCHMQSYLVKEDV